jgi:hypothetical protein
VLQNELKGKSTKIVLVTFLRAKAIEARFQRMRLAT